MPIGLLQGLRLGIREGLKIGLTDGVLVDAVASGGINVTWTVDATSGIAVPADSTEWTDLIAENGLSIAVPDHLWLCQEAAGNLSDSIGAESLTKFNNTLYQQSVAGWTRKAVGTDDSTDAFYNFNAAGGGLGQLSPGGLSHLVIAYIGLTGTPGTTRQVLTLDTNLDTRTTHVTTGPVYSARGNGVSTVDGASNPGTDVRFVAMLHNKAATEFSVITDQEKLTTSWVAPTEGGSRYLSFGDGCDSARLLYMAVFTGVNAEVSSATVRSLMQALGWNPSWS